MIFLLDTNVLLDFQHAGLLPAFARATHQVEMAMGEKVFDEVTRVKPTDSANLVGRKRHAAAELGRAKFSKLELMPDTREAALMQALLGPVGTVVEKDHGEAESIAIAASNAELVFVTGDNTAVLWTLNELFHTGERVMRVPVFVRTLLERGALDALTVRGVAERAVSHGVAPSWWKDWLAGL